MNTPKKKTSDKKSKSRSANWAAKAKALKEAALNLGKSLVNKPSSFLKNKKDQVGTKVKKWKKVSPEIDETFKEGDQGKILSLDQKSNNGEGKTS